MKWLCAALFALMLGMSSVAGAGEQPTGAIGSINLDPRLVRMTVITKLGYVSFECGGDWKIIAMQGRPPVANISFQIDNVADRATADSTNLAFTLIDPKDEQSRKSLSIIGRKYGVSEVTETSVHGWDTYLQNAIQGKTNYVVMDAKKSVADVVVHVRLAWPRLKDNRPTYDLEMAAAFNALLKSVSGSTGKYHARNGEVFRWQD